MKKTVKIVSLLVIGTQLLVGCTKVDKNKTIETGEITPVVSEKEKEKEQQEVERKKSEQALELVSHEAAVSELDIKYVIFTVKNTSDEILEYGMATITIFDSEGVVTDVLYSDMVGLKPGQARKFQVMVEDDAEKYEIELEVPETDTY